MDWRPHAGRTPKSNPALRRDCLWVLNDLRTPTALEIAVDLTLLPGDQRSECQCVDVRVDETHRSIGQTRMRAARMESIQTFSTGVRAIHNARSAIRTDEPVVAGAVGPDVALEHRVRPPATAGERQGRRFCISRRHR